MKHTHTPGPWSTSGRTIVDKTGRSICNNGNSSTGDEPANAAFIVRACNSHYELLAALEACTRYLADLNGSSWINGDDPGSVDMRQRAKGLQDLAFKATSKAKG
jgi:hypothetical protein